ncbi:MAG: hypothetical protein HYU77_13870 [Betaproteobacteria bacterium]|nr:hypothetical protein [Betaproteobacteria bacterium]
MSDEFAGQGGSYVLDPKTGKRTRVEAPTAPVPAPSTGEDPGGGEPPPAAAVPDPIFSPSTGEGQGADEPPAPTDTKRRR